MAFAVSGLSPVIITVRMPSARRSSKRSCMPGLTTSLRWTTPRTRAPSVTASGVPPALEMSWTWESSSGGTAPPWSSTQRRTESVAPLRTCRPSLRSTPLMRVWAVNGTSSAPSVSGTSRP